MTTDTQLTDQALDTLIRAAEHCASVLCPRLNDHAQWRALNLLIEATRLAREARDFA